MIKCASEKWKEIFILNDLSFEVITESCKSGRDIPIVIAKDVLKYPEQVREFMENGYWWVNGGVDGSLRPGKSFDFGYDVEKYFIPLVDELVELYDAEGNSFASSTYPNSNFMGNKIFSYKQGTGTNDTELGFPLSYLNVENIGDIVFDYNLPNDSFVYVVDQTQTTKKQIRHF